MTPTQTIKLDLSRRNDSMQRVFLGSGDRNGTTLKVLVTDDGDPFDCTGLTPYLMVGWGGSLRQEGTASGNVVTIPVDESAFGSWHGTTGNAYISLESEDMVTSTQRFAIMVHATAAAQEEDEPVDEPDDGNDDGQGNPLGIGIGG